MPGFFHGVRLQPNFFKMLSLPLVGFFIGKFFDDQETERMTMFRDKSALYGRELAEGEKPTW